MNEEDMLHEDISHLNFIKSEIVIEESDDLSVEKQDIKQEHVKSEIFKTKRNLDQHNLKAHKSLNGHSDEKDIKCDQCDKIYKSRRALWWHKSDVHSTDRPFQCNVCLETFTTNYFLKRHSIKHSIERPHKCGQCPRAFKDKSNLNHHIVHKHEEAGNFPCSVCGKAFTHINRLNSHLARHSDKRRHVCGKCDESFKFKADLSKHNKHVHTNRPIQCDVCSKEFSTLKFLQRHVTIKHGKEIPFRSERQDSNGLKEHLVDHSDERSYNCDQCNKTYKSRGALYTHKGNVHFGERHFECEVCLQTFATKRLFKKHLMKHSEERPHECEQCSKTFKEQTTLNNHIARVHGEKGEFPCGVCGRIFAHISRLNYHLTSHKDEGQHVCDVCGASFKVQEELSSHKSCAHTNKSIQCVCTKKFATLKYLQKQKLFKCDLCSKAYKTPPALSKHKFQTHGKNGLFSCDTCGKKFTVLTSLEQHLFMHSDETHFKCDQCDKTYKTETNLVVHKSYAHVPCEWCLQSFETITFLQQHPGEQEEKRVSSETEPKEQLEEHGSKYHGDNTKTNLDNHENGSFGFGMPSNHFQLKTSLDKHFEVVHLGEVKVEPIVLYDPETKQEVLDEIKEEMELDVKQEPRDFDQS